MGTSYNMPYNLRKNIGDYLYLSEPELDTLFQKYPRYMIHLAFSYTEDYFKELGNQHERRNRFKSKLLELKHVNKKDK